MDNSKLIEYDAKFISTKNELLKKGFGVLEKSIDKCNTDPDFRADWMKMFMRLAVDQKNTLDYCIKKMKHKLDDLPDIIDVTPLHLEPDYREYAPVIEATSPSKAPELCEKPANA